VKRIIKYIYISFTIHNYEFFLRIIPIILYFLIKQENSKNDIVETNRNKMYFAFLLYKLVQNKILYYHSL